jgi:cytochrome c biogenesis protein CcdA
VKELVAPIFLFGLADSLNPATIAVAIVLATGRRPVPRLLLYTFGTWATYLAGGLLLVLGPARFLHSLLHRRPTTAGHVLEIVIGTIGVAAAVWLWTRRGDSIEKRVPTEVSRPRALLIGAGITLIDLPTALMYFAAIALIARADISTTAEVTLLVVFNVAYVIPLLAVALLAGVLGPRAAPQLEAMRGFVARWGPRLLALLTGGGGAYILVKGVIGLSGR